jgi:hypothetical protein
MSKVENLNKELQAKIKAKQKELKELVQAKKIEAQLALLDSPLYQDRAIKQEDESNLNAIITSIEETLAEDKRQFYPVYGYGVTVGKLMGIVRAIQYSKVDEKADMLAMTGLNEEQIETISDAIGNPAYFSPQKMEVLPAQPMDVEVLRRELGQAWIDMGMVSKLNLFKLNQERCNYQFERAQLKAEELLDNSIKYS